VSGLGRRVAPTSPFGLFPIFTQGVPESDSTPVLNPGPLRAQPFAEGAALEPAGARSRRASFSDGFASGNRELAAYLQIHAGPNLEQRPTRQRSDLGVPCTPRVPFATSSITSPGAQRSTKKHGHRRTTGAWLRPGILGQCRLHRGYPAACAQPGPGQRTGLARLRRRASVAMLWRPQPR